MSFTYIPIDLTNCLNGIFNSCTVGKRIIRSWGFNRLCLNVRLHCHKASIAYLLYHTQSASLAQL